MNNKLTRSLFSLVALTAAVFSFAACGATVVEEGGDDINTDSASIKGGNGPNKKHTAMAMLFSELPDSSGGGDEGSSSGSSGGGDPGIDPDTVYIFLSSQGMQCSDPHAPLECNNEWRVTIAIPPELQHVGTIPLSTPGLISIGTFAGSDYGDGTCVWGGGSFWDGTIEITAIDDTHVAGVLADTQAWEFDANGAFDAVRCQF